MLFQMDVFWKVKLSKKKNEGKMELNRKQNASSLNK